MIFDTREGTSDNIVVHEVYEQDCYRWKELGLKGGVVVDIGANCGVFSCMAAQDQNAVVAYEPEWENYKRLLLNLERNNCYVVANLLAVGKPGFASISSQSGGSQLHRDGQKVLVVSLDYVLDSFTEIDFLKMDCEGSEYEIIDHASNVALKKIKRFAAEFHPDLVDAETHQRVVARLTKFFDLEITGNIPKAGGVIFGVRK